MVIHFDEVHGAFTASCREGVHTFAFRYRPSQIQDALTAVMDHATAGLLSYATAASLTKGMRYAVYELIARKTRVM